MLITILVGSSGSGKSTHAKTLNQVICSTDKYVEEQANALGISYDNSFNMSKSTGIFKKFTKYFYDDMERCIKNNINFVIDRTNLGSEIRCNLILKLKKMARSYGKTIIIKGVYFVIPENVIWQRLEHRKVLENKSIPSMLILEQIEKYELPTIDEGFDYLIKKP
ncbi:MAG: ATP-binding protein [Thiomicrorhabdus sp.]|nr:ATP-binding protein [Thiomicrorhabdus sp.]